MDTALLPTPSLSHKRIVWHNAHIGYITLAIGKPMVRDAGTTVEQGAVKKLRAMKTKNKQIFTNIFVSVQQQYWPKK